MAHELLLIHNLLKALEVLVIVIGLGRWKILAGRQEWICRN
jgi:hypothetical protein